MVESEPVVASLMTFLLTLIGYEVEAASNGKRGLELATAQRFDLILLAVDLPDINGFDLCRELKQRHISYRTPIVLLSGNDHAERRAKALELGAADFIIKPFEVEDFLERVERYTNGNQSNVFEHADTPAQSLGSAA